MPREAGQHEDGAGEDPHDFFYVLDACCDLLEEMGQTVHDEHYRDIILQAFPAEYERVPNASFEKRNFGVEFWHILHTMSTAFRAFLAPSRSQATASPCRQPDTPITTYGAAFAVASDTSCQTAPS